MIRIALTREPVTVPLEGPFAGCSVTLRRLTANAFAEAKNAALALLKDKSRLVELLEQYDLRADGRKIRELTSDPEFMAGVGEWLGAVECGVRAITALTGFADEDGKPIEPTREAMEVLFLNEPFMRQVLPMIDKAAQLLAVEGNG